MRLKYTGTSDIRSISKSEWSRVDEAFGGPIDHEAVVWDASNDFIADVSPDAAKFLLKYDPEFKEPTATDLRAVSDDDEEEEAAPIRRKAK